MKEYEGKSMEIDSTDNKLPSIVPQNDIVNLEQSIQSAEKYVELMNRIRLMAIKVLNRNDVIDQDGVPYIQKSGCDKIGAAFGIQVFDSDFEKETLSDDKGDYYVYTFSGTGSWNNHTQRELGTASSRDKFFGSVKGTYKPIFEVDITNVKKKAYTNFANRLIKKLIGLSFTWEEMEKLSDNKISRKTVVRVERGKGSSGGSTDSAETKKLRSECREMLLRLNDGEPEPAKAMLIEMTSFKTKNGEQVAGKDHINKLSEKQVSFLHRILKKKIEEFEKSLN